MDCVASQVTNECDTLACYLRVSIGILQITRLRASNNNLANTVLSTLEDVVARYGLPSRVRGDRGGENVKISVYILMKRGPNRASFVCGGV